MRTPQKERNYLAQQLKVFTWLQEFRGIKPEYSRLTFRFAQRSQGDCFLFPGRGSEDNPKNSFYIEIAERDKNYNFICLSVFLSDDYAIIKSIRLAMGWNRTGGRCDQYRRFAKSILGRGEDDKKNSGSKTLSEGNTEDEVKHGLLQSLSDLFNQIDSLDNGARLSIDDFERNLKEAINRLVAKQVICSSGNGVYQLTDTAFQDDNHMDNANNNSNNEGERGSVMKEQIEQLVQLVKSNFQVILTGAPGTGKTFMARKVAEELVCEGIANDNETEKGDAKRERIRSVQFHPGYDYSDFVIGMKPVLVSGEGKEVFRAEDDTLYTTDNGKKDGNRTVFSSKTNVSFQWKSGVFKDFANTAKGDLDHNYVFIIDEINRADLSRVFGEMFSRLEEDYRYCRDGGNAAGVLLPNGENFVIPKNLYIIGTMNDIDRSVESMDFALRRRFAWYEVAADESKAIIDAKVADQESREKLKNAMDALNEKIASADFRLGSEYQLGGAIFAKYAKYIDDNDNNGGDAFDKLWKRHIEIILKEYLRGRRTKEKDLKDLKDIYDGNVGQLSLAAGSATTNSSESPSSTGADD